MLRAVAGVARRLVYRVHFVLAGLLGVVAFLALSLAGILAVALFRSLADRAPHVFAHAYSRFMQVMLGWRLRAQGLEIFQSAKPAVIVGNHQSNLDIVTYGGIYPASTKAVGKKELEKIPLFGWFFRETGNILLDRGNRRRAFDAIGEAARRVREERLNVWMFPEGHRNQKPELLPFKKGAFHLAIAAQVPVVVVVQEPISGVLDARRLLVRPGRLRFRVLPPIPTAGRTEADVDALIDEVRQAMQGARDELARDARTPIA